jgi:hypothetical protein
MRAARRASLIYPEAAMPTNYTTLTKRNAVQNHRYMMLGQSRMSKTLQGLLPILPAWQPGASIMPAFIAAELITRAGLQCRVIDGLSEMHLVYSEEDDRRIPSTPWVHHGMPTEVGVSTDKAFVLIRDGNRAVLYDPALSALSHPKLPVMADALIGIAHSDMLSILDKGPRDMRYVGAMEWFLRAPCGGVAMVTWALRDACPSWFAQAQACKFAATVLADALLAPQDNDVSVIVAYA